MNNHELQPASDWLVASARLVCRQWPTWLLANGVQMGILVVSALGFVIGIVAPIVVLMRSPYAGGGMTVWLPIAVVVAFGAFVVFQLITAWTNAATTFGFAHGPQRAGPVGDAFQCALQRIFRAFWVNIAVSLILGGALFCLVIPFFVVAPALFMAWFIAVLEDRPVRDALAISWVRTRGLRGEILLRLLIVFGALLGASLLLGMMQTVPLMGMFSLPFSVLLHMVTPVLYMAACYLLYQQVMQRPVSSPCEEAPMGLLYLLAGWGVVGCGVMIAAVYALVKTVPNLLSYFT